MSKVSNKGVYKFWAALRTLANSRSWKRDLDSDGEIRLYDKDGNEYCPLTAVYKKLNNEYVDMGQTNIVRDALKMESVYESRIVGAADDCDSHNKTQQRLRNKMIKVLKLKKKNEQFLKNKKESEETGW
jgi:hypothetical protein